MVDHLSRLEEPASRLILDHTVHDEVHKVCLEASFGNDVAFVESVRLELFKIL